MSEIEISELWIFAYGSLIWDRCFKYEVESPAYLRGYHRKLCVLSHNYRGTIQKPGLVFGLKKGGSCHGLAFKIERKQIQESLSRIREREKASGVYKERLVSVTLPSNQKIHALAYVVDHRHPKYISALEDDALFEFVKDSAGVAGRNLDYIVNTYHGLSSLGLKDDSLKGLSEKLHSYARFASKIS